jgi:hypothetical protein
LDGEHGVLGSLFTTHKTDFVGSINEVYNRIGPLDQLTTDIGTRDHCVEAINNVLSKIGTIASLTTTAKNTVVASVNELDSEVGTLSTLDTTAKNTLVAAVNEVFGMHLIGNAVFTIGGEANDVIRVTVQLKDSSGTNIANRSTVFAYLSNNNNGTTLLGTAHSGGWEIGTEGVLIPMVANKAAHLVTNAAGLVNVDITETGTKTAYLVVTLPNGKNVVSAAITHET